MIKQSNVGGSKCVPRWWCILCWRSIESQGLNGASQYLSIYLSIYLYIYIYTHKILGIIGSSEMDTFQPEWGFIVELWSSISNVGYVYGSFLFPQTIRFLRLIILTYLPRAVSWEDDFLAKENMFQHVPTHQPMLKLGLEQWILVDVFYGHVRPFGDDSTIIPVRSQSVTIHEICEEHGLWMFQCWSIWPGEFSPAITTCSPWRGGEIGVAAFGGVRMRCRIYNDISWRSTCGCPIRYKLYTYVYVCMYIYMHTYIHPSIHTYIHTYIHYDILCMYHIVSSFIPACCSQFKEPNCQTSSTATQAVEKPSSILIQHSRSEIVSAWLCERKIRKSLHSAENHFFFPVDKNMKKPIYLGQSPTCWASLRGDLALTVHHKKPCGHMTGLLACLLCVPMLLLRPVTLLQSMLHGSKYVEYGINIG